MNPTKISSKVKTVTLLMFSFLFISTSAYSETLKSKSYEVLVEVLCPEGHVTCDNVRFTVIEKKTGKKFIVKGETQHTYDEEGTPKRWLGYKFKHDNKVWFLEGFGNLRIEDKNRKELFSEKGRWEY